MYCNGILSSSNVGTLTSLACYFRTVELLIVRSCELLINEWIVDGSWVSFCQMLCWHDMMTRGRLFFVRTNQILTQTDMYVQLWRLRDWMLQQLQRMFHCCVSEPRLDVSLRRLCFKFSGVFAVWHPLDVLALTSGSLWLC